jgi:hypothetical protein
MAASRCSFCNRTVNEVERIIAGPDQNDPVHICNECVEACVGILREPAGEVDARKRFKPRRSFYDSLSVVIAVLIVAGIVLCLRAYSAGGLSDLRETAAIWLAASVVAVLVGRWLRKLGQVNK